MNNGKLYCAGGTPAVRYALEYLRRHDFPISDRPGADTNALLLDVPSFCPDGALRSGGCIQGILDQLPGQIIVFGGNLNHPALEGYRTADLLKDPQYLAENAYITAEAAIEIALSCLSITLRRCPTLVMGWGRIGKCLARLLHAIGADVTVTARKASDRAICQALGYKAIDTPGPETDLLPYRLIFNTIPEKILSSRQTERCHPDCVKIDLASKNGIEGPGVIYARGLPGIHMPESSGKLIGQTLIRLYQEES